MVCTNNDQTDEIRILLFFPIFYRSSDSGDELRWGALWLYMATRDTEYLTKAMNGYDGSRQWAFDWDDKDAGVQVCLNVVVTKLTLIECCSQYQL